MPFFMVVTLNIEFGHMLMIGGCSCPIPLAEEPHRSIIDL
ncbi:hypothetical protein SynA1560_01085 [Synechococcus sp. A15-60]|nr:hypothetical protein SynA1560_01085 [Synechococcus sp. A15-60]